jgi:hypothetical protein
MLTKVVEEYKLGLLTDEELEDSLLRRGMDLAHELVTVYRNCFTMGGATYMALDAVRNDLYHRIHYFK